MMIELNNRAVLDGDILAYRAAWWADKEGVDLLENRLIQDVEDWSQHHANTLIAFSCNREDNFRRDYFPLYKRNRTSRAEPEHLSYAHEILDSNFDTIRRDKIEADDILGMLTSANTGTAVSIDKDLRNVPGWHWNPDKENEPVFITEEEADLTLHVQWLSGDSTDNIYGAWNWGPKKAEKLLSKLDTEDWVAAIMEIYNTCPRPKHKRIKGVCDMEPDEFALSQAICVRILRQGEYIDGEAKLWNPIVECP